MTLSCRQASNKISLDSVYRNQLLQHKISEDRAVILKILKTSKLHHIVPLMQWVRCNLN